MMLRLRYVLLNYLTRPLMWVLALIYLGVLGASIHGAIQATKVSLQPAYPQISSWGKMATLMIPNQMGDAVDPSLTHLTIIVLPLPEVGANNPTSVSLIDTFHQLADRPKLRALTLHGNRPLDEEEITALAKIKSLQSISLYSMSVQPTMWKNLGQLPNLRFLEITSCSLSGNYPDLESFQRLETLALSVVTENDTPLLPELRRLPRLQSIVLNHYSAIQKKHGSPQAHPERQGTADPLVKYASDLQAIATLQNLYVDENSSTFSGFDVVGPLLPRCLVRPAFVNAERQYMLFAVFVLTSLVFLPLVLQFHSQFAHPSACLAPDYIAPHLIPMVAIWLSGTLANSIPLMITNVPFAAACGIGLLGSCFLCGLTVLGTLSPADSKKIQKWILIPLICAAVARYSFGIRLLQLNRSSIDWYLRGNEPGWTWSFIAVGVAISMTALWRSRRLLSMYLERGISSPPLGYDAAAMAEWQQELYWKQLSTQRPTWLTRGVTRRLERAIADADRPGLLRRCNLWIAANMTTGNSIPPVAFAVVIVLMVVGFFNGELLDGFPYFSNPIGLMMTVFLPDISIIAPASIWRSRRRMFAMESLRPISRLQFAREIAAAIAWDLSPLGWVYLGLLTWYTSVADADRWSWTWTIAMLLVFASRWIMMYGLTIWAMTIRRDWLVVLLAFFIGYSLVFVNFAIILFQGPVLGVKQLPPDLPHIGVVALTGMALLFGLAACVVTHFAYRRWQQIELV